MLVIVAQGKFAWMLLSYRGSGQGFLGGHVGGPGLVGGVIRGIVGGLVRGFVRVGLLGQARIVARLCRTIFWSVDRLGSREITPQILLQLIEGERLAEIVARSPELCEPTADRSREFRHSLWSKDQKRDNENHDELEGSDSEHT